MIKVEFQIAISEKVKSLTILVQKLIKGIKKEIKIKSR
jgi:hypothetical protein